MSCILNTSFYLPILVTRLSVTKSHENFDIKPKRWTFYEIFAKRPNININRPLSNSVIRNFFFFVVALLVIVSLSWSNVKLDKS